MLDFLWIPLQPSLVTSARLWQFHQPLISTRLPSPLIQGVREYDTKIDQDQDQDQDD